MRKPWKRHTKSNESMNLQGRRGCVRVQDARDSVIRLRALIRYGIRWIMDVCDFASLCRARGLRRGKRRIIPR